MARYLALSARIAKELQDLQQVVDRCLDIWQQSESSGDDRYLDGVALNLHSFYTALERVFELVATEVDQSVPGGPGGHQALLRQAATAVPRLRPAMLTDGTRARLDRYRGFGHVVRNIYAFELDKAQIAPLIDGLRGTFETVRSELLRFADAMAQLDDPAAEAE